MTMAAFGAALIAAAGASAADFSGGGAAGVALSRGYAAAPGIADSPGRSSPEAAPRHPSSGATLFDADFTAVLEPGTAPVRPRDR